MELQFAVFDTPWVEPPGWFLDSFLGLLESKSAEGHEYVYLRSDIHVKLQGLSLLAFCSVPYMF